MCRLGEISEILFWKYEDVVIFNKTKSNINIIFSNCLQTKYKFVIFSPTMTYWLEKYPYFPVQRFFISKDFGTGICNLIIKCDNWLEFYNALSIIIRISISDIYIIQFTPNAVLSQFKQIFCSDFCWLTVRWWDFAFSVDKYNYIFDKF